MEIEVGEYVRIKNGPIRKIIKINEGKEKTVFGKYRLDKQYNNCRSVAKSKILSHSKNIIDLIQEGDYVNGYYCKRILNFNNEICNFDLNEMRWILLTEIDVWESVVTKEQFSSVEYLFEEE